MCCSVPPYVKLSPAPKKIPECRPARMHIPAMRRGMVPGVLKTRRVTCSAIGSHSCQETRPKIDPARRIQFINSRTANSGIRHRIDSNFYPSDNKIRSLTEQSIGQHFLCSSPSTSFTADRVCRKSYRVLKYLTKAHTTKRNVSSQTGSFHPTATKLPPPLTNELKDNRHLGNTPPGSLFHLRNFKGKKKRTKKKRYHESFSSHGRSLPSHIHLHPAAEDANVEGVQ